MKIKLLSPIKYHGNPFGIAVSGGADSMAALKFLTLYPKNNIHVYHVNHGSSYDNDAEALVKHFCSSNNLPLHLHKLHGAKDINKSWEEHWRDERYKFLNSFDMDIITGHNLDDCVETWIFSSLHGSSKLIPHRNKNIYRPFMLTKKSEMVQFCIEHDVPYLDDPNNESEEFARNIIRRKIVPEALRVNPGLYKTISKKLKFKLQQEGI